MLFLMFGDVFTRIGKRIGIYTCVNNYSGKKRWSPRLHQALGGAVSIKLLFVRANYQQQLRIIIRIRPFWVMVKQDGSKTATCCV